MPTFREYKNENGFYILAWGPDSGNITYQVRSEADEILRKVGFEDGNEIGWPVVNVLQAAGLVYTGGQGVDPMENRIDLGREGEMGEISKQQAQELVSELESLSSVDPDTVSEIKDILDIEIDVEKSTGDKETALSDLETEIDSRVEKVIKSGDHTSRLLSEGNNPSFTAESRSDDGNTSIHLRTVADFKIDHGYGAVFLFFTADEEKGLHHIEAAVDTRIDWEKRAEIHRTLADLLPIVTSALRHKGMDPGDGTNNLQIQIGYL